MRLFQSPIFLQFRVKSRGQRGLKVTLVRGYNVDTLWLCLLQNKVEELNQRLRQALDGQCLSMLPSVVVVVGFFFFDTLCERVGLSEYVK